MPVNRLSGLSSGMDTEALVKQLMDAERIPVNKMKQKRDTLAWQSESYRQWNTDMFTFRTKTLFDMKLSKTYGTFNVVSSNSNKMTGTATADALTGTHKVEVLQLAEEARVIGKPGSAVLTAADDLTITMNGKTATIDLDGTETMSDIVSKINSAQVEGKNIGVRAAYDETLNQFLITSKDTGSTAAFSLSGSNVLAKLGISQFSTSSVTGDAGGTSKLELNLSTISSIGSAGGVINVTVGGVEKSIKLSNTDNETTLKDKLSRAFSNTDLTLTADPATNKLTLTPADGKALTIAAFDQNVLTTGLQVSSTAASSVNVRGRDGQIRYNDGEVLNVEKNNTSIFGINYTFKDIGIATATVSRDIDAQVKNIKEFITKYNEILEKANKTIEEPIYRSFQPLTKEEREALTEKQIEQWESKAKSGLLRRDSILSELATNLRLHMSSTVDNGSKYNSLSSIGIKSASYKDQGKLYVDEDKLKKAIEEDPEAVKNLFTQSDEDDKSGKAGFLHRIYNDFGDAIEKLTKKAGVTGSATTDSSVVGKIVRDLDKRIDDAEARLIQKENSYYAKFTAMEKAMSKYNSQSGWLSQQFAAQ